MSFILDALRKAERERNLGQAPTLDARYVVTTTSARRFPLWLLVGGSLAAVSLVVAIGLALRSEPEVAPDTLVGVAVPPAPAPVILPPAPVETVTVQTADGPLQAELPAMPESPIEADAISPEPPDDAPAQTLTPDTAPPAPASAPAKRAEPEPPLEELPAGEPPQEAIGPDTPEEPAPIVPRGRARLDIPSYEGLPDSVRGGMQPLNMNAHVFSSVPGRGFVMVNGKKYREGDALAEGPEVVEIIPEGAVLRFRGTDFLLPVPR